MKYNICIVRPDNYIHSAAFMELAQLVGYGLEDLGHLVAISVNRTFAEAQNIIIGCHLLDPSLIDSTPKTSIIINTEQLSADRLPWHDKIDRWVTRFETWDYSERNLAPLKEIGAREPKLLRLGFHKQLTRIHKSTPQDIDVLFYGSIGDRRKKIIEDLKATGSSVMAVFGVYGEERDKLIARSKVVLNLHHYDSHVFEIVRVFYLLINAKAVVGEVGDDTAIDPFYLPAIRAARYDDLVKSCLDLVANREVREEMERRALETISSRPQSELLAPLLG
jgi:hypothetical protein